MNTYRLSVSCLLLCLGMMSGACGTLQLGVEDAQSDSGTLVTPSASEQPQTNAAGGFTPTPLESPPAQTNVNETLDLLTSDRLGLCFSYPQGYTLLPYNDAVEIAAPILGPGHDAGLFWLDISDSQNRTAEEVATQESNDVAGLNPDRWTVMLGGEEALVLDGMPGQNLVRRVYIVHHETLFILTFSPTRLENSVASEQMEALYTAVTSTWAWSPCSESE